MLSDGTDILVALANTKCFIFFFKSRLYISLQSLPSLGGRFYIDTFGQKWAPKYKSIFGSRLLVIEWNLLSVNYICVHRVSSAGAGTLLAFIFLCSLITACFLKGLVSNLTKLVL